MFGLRREAGREKGERKAQYRFGMAPSMYDMCYQPMILLR